VSSSGGSSRPSSSGAWPTQLLVGPPREQIPDFPPLEPDESDKDSDSEEEEGGRISSKKRKLSNFS